jgi:hypothetical protein
VKFWIDAPFIFMDSNGTQRVVDFMCVPNTHLWGNRPELTFIYSHVFSTEEPGWHLPDDWAPPILGLRPMDAEAQAALHDVRVNSGKVGQQLPGIGMLQADEPIFNP